MMNRRNYYRILHIQQDAPAAIIKASYQAQMQKLRMHPDLGGDEWNAAVLNEAYQVLSDPDRRSAYDKALAATLKQQRTTPGASTAQATRTASPPGTPDPSCCAFCGTKRPAPATTCGPQDCPGCGGPLETVRSLRIAGRTERSLDRRTQLASMIIYTHPDCTGLPARLRDLSPAGLQMLLARPLAAGLLIRIHSTAVRAIARVRFCNRDLSGRNFIIGMEFVTLQFPTRIGGFLSTHA